MSKRQTLLEEIRQCTLCLDELPLAPRPVLNFAAEANILLVGQAPGIKVHETGIPWHDASGERLRDWLQVSSKIFYDPKKIAIVPMGFCYPGKGKTGDLPPMKRCAPTWMPPILQQLPKVQLTLLVGAYAQKYFLQASFNGLTQTVKDYKKFLPNYFPLPHPSPRNNIWLKKNPWFEENVLSDLRQIIKAVL
ncbi:MAG TPA: uracil-DNA glycosylase family protein [Oligoflexia bacterium]|mgnify:CR=1 FL=1|nr:uracil-DNA glycosylase family protein [Oligoflexia bacterium]HMR25145.1 uracil-DNA glycosylase family protein [Oligoflexia bacterium]